MKNTLKLLLFISLLVNVILLYKLATLEQKNTADNSVATTTENIQTKEEAMFESGKSYPLMRVVDGDTIVVGFNGKTERVRLIGINSPELNDPGGAQCYAKEASEHLQELAQTGLVVLYFDKSQGMRDKFNRLLAYVELPDKTDLGKQMLADGYAREYTYDTKYERQNEYKQAEKEAMTKEKGLWKPGTCE